MICAKLQRVTFIGSYTNISLVALVVLEELFGAQLEIKVGALHGGYTVSERPKVELDLSG